MRPSTVGLVTILLLAPLASGASLPPLPASGNDSGSGRDAGSDDTLAVAVGEGSFTGALTPADPSDRYRLQPGEPMVVRISFEADPQVIIYLYRANGATLDWTFGNEGNLTATLAAEPHALHVQRNGGTRAQTTGYRITIAYEHHDHVVPLLLEDPVGVAARWTTPEGRFGRVELYPDLLTPARPDEPYAVGEDYQLRDEDGPIIAGNGIRSSPGEGGLPRVEVRGRAPADLALDLPLGDGDSAQLERLLMEGSGRSYSVLYGLASSHGIRMRGWAVWDGPAFPLDFPEGVRATFLMARDLGGNGTLLQAGPLVEAENLSATLSLPHRTLFVYVDASPPESARAPPAFTVTTPEGESVNVADRDMFWSQAMFRPHFAPPGEWSVHLHHLDGNEGNRHRVMAMSFPYEPIFAGP